MKLIEIHVPKYSSKAEKFLLDYLPKHTPTKVNSYNISPDGKFNVHGLVDISSMRLLSITDLDIKFGEIHGAFHCQNNGLQNLAGGPSFVTHGYMAYDNMLTTLEGGPREVGGSFLVYNNKLTSLKGAPRDVGSEFDTRFNKLKDFSGMPAFHIGGPWYCSANPLESFDHWNPKAIISGSFVCIGQDKAKLKELPPESLFNNVAGGVEVTGAKDEHGRGLHLFLDKNRERK